jgi:hypothetical protein
MSALNEAIKVSRSKVGNFYLKLWVCAGVAFILVMIGSLLNYAHLYGVNLILGGLGLALIAFLVFSPKSIFYFFGLGAIVAELKDKDITQGAVEGVSWIWRVFLAIASAYMALFGLLATWPFSNNPMAFWYIAFFGTFLLVIYAYYKVESGKMMFRFAVFYALAVIGWNFYSTIDDTTKAYVGSLVPSNLTNDQSGQLEEPILYAEPEMRLEVCTPGKTPKDGSVNVFKPLEPPGTGQWVLVNPFSPDQVKVWVKNELYHDWVESPGYLVKTSRGRTVACAVSEAGSYSGFAWTE